MAVAAMNEADDVGQRLILLRQRTRRKSQGDRETTLRMFIVVCRLHLRLPVNDAGVVCRVGGDTREIERRNYSGVADLSATKKSLKIPMESALAG